MPDAARDTPGDLTALRRTATYSRPIDNVVVWFVGFTLEHDDNLFEQRAAAGDLQYGAVAVLGAVRLGWDVRAVGRRAAITVGWVADRRGRVVTGATTAEGFGVWVRYVL